MKKSAFTLVEVLLAFTIFTAGLLTLLSVVSQTRGISAMTITRTRADLLAQEGIELTIPTSYADLAVGEFRHESSLADIGETFAPFARVVTIQTVDKDLHSTPTDQGLKLITSTVTWTAAAHDASNIPKTITLRTLRSQ